MSSNNANANLGWPAVATTASGSGATPFNAMPPTPSSSSSRGRGRHPTTTPYQSRPSAPRRPPQEPKLPVTLGQGGQILPNSAAELEAHGRAMAEFGRALAVFNEVVEASGSRHRGQKRNNQSQNSGNGNYPNYSGLNPFSGHANQNRELVSSYGSQHPSTSADPNGNANQNALRATNQAHQAHPQELNDEFLLEFNSLQPVAQLDLIRTLDREQGRRGTSNVRRVEIALFLRTIKVEDPVEGPQAKKLMLDKNGRPIFEVLSLYSSKDKQLALTKEDSTTIYLAASDYIAGLAKSRMNPEWLWASWSKYRGRIAVTSEIQAKLVTALFNSLKVAGVPLFRAWRDHEVEELTSVRLTLSGGFLFTWPVDKIIRKLLSWNELLGTYSEPSQGQPTVSHHVVHFKVDQILKKNLAKHQKGSGTFFLPLVGQDREIHMARDHQVVAAEAAAGLRVRIETALAKAIAASRPDLGPGAAPPATTDGQKQQQQQGNEITKKNSIQSPNPDTYSKLGHGSVSPPLPEPETEFVKLQRQLLQELPEQQGEEPQVTLETAQQPGAPEHVPQQGTPVPQPAAHLSALEIWEQQHQHHRHPLPTLQPGAQEPSIALALRQANEKQELAQKHQQQLLQTQQQHQHQSGTTTISISVDKIFIKDSPPIGVLQPPPTRESRTVMALRQVDEKRELALQHQQQLLESSRRTASLGAYHKRASAYSPPEASLTPDDQHQLWQSEYQRQRLLLSGTPDPGKQQQKHQQQQHQQQEHLPGRISFGTKGQDPADPNRIFSPSGIFTEVSSVVGGVRSVFDLDATVSPTHDAEALKCGLPLLEDSGASSGSSSSEATSRRAQFNTSTGSTKVDELEVILGDPDMEVPEPESDTEIYALARSGNELGDDDHMSDA
jgi:hypothetical protein